MQEFSPSPTTRRQLRAFGVGASLLLVTTTIWAATFRHADKHVTQKTPEHVWNVLTAYAETCDKGCKYSRPSLVKVQKLQFQATSTRWYTWSHVGNTFKDAKYFTEVTLQRKADGHFTSVNRQLDANDKALIETLENKTGLKHSPIFDGGATKTVTSSSGGKTVISQVVTLEVGALMGLWAGKIQEEMEKNISATFRNIEK